MILLTFIFLNEDKASFVSFLSLSLKMIYPTGLSFTDNPTNVSPFSILSSKDTKDLFPTLYLTPSITP